MLKKLLLALLLLIVVLVGGAYLGGGWLLGRATHTMLPRFAGLAERAGLRVVRWDFRDASVRPPARLRWNDWQVEVVRATATANSTDPLRLRIGAIHLVTTDWSPLTAELHVEEVALETPFVPSAPADLPFASDEFGVAIDRIDGGRLVLAKLDLSAGPRAVASALARELTELARDGRTTRELELGASLHFRLKGRPLTVRLETERRHGATWLRFNASDIAELSRRYDRPLTSNEQQLLCEHPQRALLLLRIKEYAERLSQRLARTDRAYGEDFTRHVIWSYWLTRTFGPDFAQQVTDAHEAGATDNTAADHRQDYANNLVGRTYAAAKKSENQVLKLIKTDPLIVRQAK
ncbi:MAG: hypothetical protein QM691_08235 [Opitutaceae bacterium]